MTRERDEVRSHAGDADPKFKSRRSGIFHERKTRLLLAAKVHQSSDDQITAQR